MRIPFVYHAIAALFVALCMWLASARPDFYGALMQEDQVVEWATVATFAVAGIARLAAAVRTRRVFDGLVALFCIFVAGEEINWGQRLFGLTPPTYFLEHNTQQEMNVHNFADLFGSPKFALIAALAGYAIVLPLVAATGRGSRLLARIGATAPPRAILLWFVVAIVLLLWYPFRFTGEWTELLAGSAFLVTSRLSGAALAAASALGVVFAAAMAHLASRGDRDPQLLACARAELQAIARVVQTQLSRDDRLHRRVWTLMERGNLDSSRVRAGLASVRCPTESPDRRAFAVDPWGTAYWVRVTRESTTVYSFGPNRRRDRDDVSIVIEMPF